MYVCMYVRMYVMNACNACFVIIIVRLVSGVSFDDRTFLVGFGFLVRTCAWSSWNVLHELLFGVA